ncbi:MAG: hypothetical protein Q9180_009410 [Flavoplaca navasiana]
MPISFYALYTSLMYCLQGLTVVSSFNYASASGDVDGPTQWREQGSYEIIVFHEVFVDSTTTLLEMIAIPPPKLLQEARGNYETSVPKSQAARGIQITDHKRRRSLLNTCTLVLALASIVRGPMSGPSMASDAQRYDLGCLGEIPYASRRLAVFVPMLCIPWAPLNVGDCEVADLVPDPKVKDDSSATREWLTHKRSWGRVVD